jgi:hypothetical protein
MKNAISCLTIGCVLLTVCWISVARADTLQAPDTTIIKQELPLWSDSALALPDTIPPSTAFAQRWLIPLGVMVVSGAVAVVLFAVRSR